MCVNTFEIFLQIIKQEYPWILIHIIVIIILYSKKVENMLLAYFASVNFLQKWVF